jgi:hypothetical protein
MGVIISEIKEIHCEVNEEGDSIQFGDSGWYEPCTGDKGKLFLSLQRDFGRCISKMYRDFRDKNFSVVCGWVFEKRMKYTDCSETYLQHTWIEVKWSYEFSEAA